MGDDRKRTLGHIDVAGPAIQRRVDELVLSATRGQAAALSPSPLALRPVHHFIANLRSTGTDTYQFRNLVDQSYRLLFDHTDIGLSNGVIDTPVNNPAQQRAVYMHPRCEGIDYTCTIEDPCIAAVLRAGLRSAIIIGDKVEHLTGKTPNYALFRISRSHGKKEH